MNVVQRRIDLREVIKQYELKTVEVNAFIVELEGLKNRYVDKLSFYAMCMSIAQCELCTLTEEE